MFKQNLATRLLKAAPDLVRAVWAGPRGRSLLTTPIWYIFTVSDQTPTEDLTQRDIAGLGQLRIAIKSNRAWPEPSL